MCAGPWQGIRVSTMSPVPGRAIVLEVTYAPSETSLAKLCQQVMDTVVLPGVRSFLGRFSSPQ